MSSNNPLDPYGLTSPIQQQALAQQALTDNTYKAISKAYGLGTRSAELQAAQLYPDAPQLKFNTNANSIGEGIMQGLGNAVNNTYQLKNYRSKREMIDNAVLEQRQRENQQIEMAQRQADAQQVELQRQYTDGLAVLNSNERTKPLAAHYQAVGPEERAKIMAEARGFYTSPTKIGLDKGAEAQAKLQEELAAFKQHAELLKGADINTPEGQNLFRAFMGFAATTQDDIRQKHAQAGSAEEGLYRDHQNNQVLPENNALDLEKKRVGNQIQNLQLMRDYVTTRYAEDNAYEDLRAKQLRGEITADELNRLQRLPEVVAAAMDRIQSGQGLTAAESFELQTTINVLAHKDPKFAETFKDYGFTKKDKNGNFSLDQKAFDAFAKGQQGYGGLPSLSIQPAAQKGHVMQSPTTGKWYDTSRKGADGLPVEVAAPGGTQAPKPKATAPAKPKADPYKGMTAQQRGAAKRDAAIKQGVSTVKQAGKQAVSQVGKAVDAVNQAEMRQVEDGAESQGFWGLPFNPNDPLGWKRSFHGLK